MLLRSKIKNDELFKPCSMHQKSIQDFSWKIIWVIQTQTEGYHWYTEVKKKKNWLEGCE